MTYFLMLLVASVFLGTELLAVATPFAQLTIYRICALSIPVLLVYFMTQSNSLIKIKKNSYASFSIMVFVFWWVWSLVSFLWIEDIRLWLQAVFLLTIGVSSIVGLYLGIRNEQDWKKIIQGAWIMMSLLVLLGYYEIITNNYLFANLGKLDKYSTFVSQPMTRIPITHFENQNDFATMLLSYIAVSSILYYLTPKAVKKIGYIIAITLGSYLIYRSGSRMILLCLILYIISLIALKYRWDIRKKYYIIGFSILIIAGIFAVIYIPAVYNTFDTLIYTSSSDIITGDTGRVNLIRNGLVFLASTLGLGVGAGNIEYWMENYRFLPTQNIVNIHNWWGEILVAYGIIVFVLYILAYALLIYRLFQIRKSQSRRLKNVSNQIISFLFVYILASITSASNMLIEWHWVFFGLIVSYIKVSEKKLITNSKHTKGLKRKYELDYSSK